MSEAAPSLAARVRAGDPRAFAELVRAHERRLYNIALGMTRNPDDARDILQETLLSAWRSIGGLHEDARLEPWLCRITTNAARMHLRARRRRPVEPLDDLEAAFDRGGLRLERTAPWPVDPADTIARARLAARVGELALELPDEYREVWVLADIEQMSMQEVADVLELTVPNVKTRLHRARLALRQKLARELVPAGGRR